MGSDAHSEAFIRRCNRFCYIDILQGYEPERCLTPLSEIISDVYRIIIEERASGICTELSGLIHKLTKLHTEFDTRNYGYASDIAFLLSFPKLEIYNNKGVKLKQSFKLK